MSYLRQVFNQEKAFIGTLDYIFHSEGWNVESVLKLPDRAEMEGPMPLQHEPSDHLLIGATMNLQPPRSNNE